MKSDPEQTNLSALALIALVFLLLPNRLGAEVCGTRGISRAALEKIDAALLLDFNDKLQIQEIHLPWGIPGTKRLLYHKEFIVSYDTERRVPVWVAYRLRGVDIIPAERLSGFRTDPRLSRDESASCDDYMEPIFDRGHLVSPRDMNRSVEAQAYTFFMSNMTPQHARFNRGIWFRLERLVRNWAKVRGTIYVVSGTVFDRDNDRSPDGLEETQWMQPSNRVGIPTHFYKILAYISKNGTLETISFLLPNVNTFPQKGIAYLQEHLVSIDEIERRTGLDFLNKLPPNREREVERAVARNLWPTGAVIETKVEQPGVAAIEIYSFQPQGSGMQIGTKYSFTIRGAFLAQGAPKKAKVILNSKPKPQDGMYHLQLISDVPTMLLVPGKPSKVGYEIIPLQGFKAVTISLEVFLEGASKAIYSTPPRKYEVVKSEKSWQVIRDNITWILGSVVAFLTAWVLYLQISQRRRSQ